MKWCTNTILLQVKSWMTNQHYAGKVRCVCVCVSYSIFLFLLSLLLCLSDQLLLYFLCNLVILALTGHIGRRICAYMERGFKDMVKPIRDMQLPDSFGVGQFPANVWSYKTCMHDDNIDFKLVKLKLHHSFHYFMVCYFLTNYPREQRLKLKIFW